MQVFYPVSRDRAYTITHEGPRKFVVRRGAEIIGVRMFYDSAVVLAVGQSAVDRGALVITAIEA